VGSVLSVVAVCRVRRSLEIQNVQIARAADHLHEADLMCCTLLRRHRNGPLLGNAIYIAFTLAGSKATFRLCSYKLVRERDLRSLLGVTLLAPSASSGAVHQLVIR
jgi:hypothetical protein